MKAVNKLMEAIMNNNNQVVAKGRIASKFMFSHKEGGEKFYKIILGERSPFGIKDRVAVLVSEYLWDPNVDKGVRVAVEGEYRTQKVGKMKHEKQYVFATEIYPEEYTM